MNEKLKKIISEIAKMDKSEFAALLEIVRGLETDES